MQFILFIYSIISMIQAFLGFGTAYRLTKNGGDNGVSLFGWMFLMQLVSVIPGLGIYIYIRCKDM
ncbi:MAG: hypothetical protein FWC95_08180 [Defluviitaleaceae bacterium]|nr:hypothetical protein [Defluviitaleaceae bacterium]